MSLSASCPGLYMEQLLLECDWRNKSGQRDYLEALLSQEPQKL